MQRQLKYSWFIALMMVVLAGFTLAGLAIPITAQEGAVFATNTPEGAASGPIFATNTPAAATPGSDEDASVGGSTPIFSTNTPEGMNAPPLVFATVTPDANQPVRTEPTATPLGPLTDLFNYSMRIWLEQDMVNFAAWQVAQVRDEVHDAELALQVTLFELEERFPGAPHRDEQRVQMLDAMLQAPIGSIDMRSMVRPLVESALNQEPDTTGFILNGFEITVTAVNLDNAGDLDGLIHIQYVDEDETLRYDDYVLSVRQDDGSFAFLADTYDLYAAPFGGIERITVQQIADVNRDGRDEVVLRVADDGINERLYILAYRNGIAVELTQPGEEIRFGEVVSWPVDNPDIVNPTLNVLRLQSESALPDWPCNSSQAFTWTYDRNFYRVSTELNSRYELRDTLGCALYDAEPLFSLPPADAINLIESALLDYGFEAPGSNRALMTLAMLYVMQGRLDDARSTAQSILAGDGDTWATQQANALVEGLGISSNTALDICEALATASPNPACDMNAVLGRFLSALDLTGDADLVEQLENFGLPVAEAVTVTEVGRADRTVVSFLLADSGWWGFYKAPLGHYLVEPAAAPEGFASAAFPQGQVSIPDAAWNALFVDHDPAKLLAILENLENQNPEFPLAVEGLYLRALSYDLTAQRTDARETYYEVWDRYPNTIWGTLAANHLEQR